MLFRSHVSESARQPRPNRAEFDAAVAIAARDPALGPAIRDTRLRPYRPMPPLVRVDLSDGRTDRVVAVGLLPTAEGLQHEIVGVSMRRRAVIRFDEMAPAGAVAIASTCGLPNANQPTDSSSPGQAWVTVSQGGTVLWRFLVVRPAASSGAFGSGVELRFVDYRGKRVLYRAHVPILNVKYDDDACGPYRDWQNEEGMFQATGADVGSGFRLCGTPAQTILASGSDTGNFNGVAVYLQGQEVVLVSEMEAGWYRYVSEWRLHVNGSIRPRFGFSAVEDSCVCTIHHHHVYWRLDFDIRTASRNVVLEHNVPRIFGRSAWHTLNFETQRFRDPARHRTWRVKNSVSGEAYDIIPGPDDGAATASPDWPFPRGDVWILKYRASEIDDGAVLTSDEAALDAFADGEPINNQDVVIWYAAHVTHEVGAEPPGTFGHIAGPTLKPVNW